MVTKGQVLQCLQNELSVFSVNNGGVAVSTMVKIDESPEVLRHACVNGGISHLQRQIYSCQTPVGVVQVPYFFCGICGKLFVYNDFM